jgi:DNA-binding response OmpR family regulator
MRRSAGWARRGAAVGGRRLAGSALRALTVGGAPFDPPPRERTLLEVVLRAAPRPVAKETLEARLAGLDRAVQPNAVEVYVYRLRARLGQAGAGAVIQTVRGLGYRLEAAPASGTPPTG